MKFLAANPPDLPVSVVEGHLIRAYGLTGRMKPLYSERDQNLLLRLPDRRAFVVKVMNGSEDAGQLDCQIAALDHIARVDPTLNVPRVLPTLEGGPLSEIAAPDGALFQCYLLSFLEGEIAVERPLSRGELHRIGALLAQLQTAMRGFFHPSLNARPLLWDPRQIGQLSGHVDLLPSEHRGVARQAIDRFLGRTLPRLAGLRAQALHADLHRHNLVVAPDEAPLGVIDFGDMLHGPIVIDLANALSDFSDAETLLPTTEAILSGFTARIPLEDAETDTLYDLVLMRVLVAALIMAYRATHTPDTPDYTAGEAFGSFALMRQIAALGPDTLTDHFRKASGMAPAPGRSVPLSGLLERRRRLMGSRPYLFYDPPLHMVRGDGVWLTDAGGRRYLDFYNNVPIVGHCNPAVTEAIARQARVLNTNTRYLGEQVLDYAERLGALTGGALTACAFVNSGSEANDIAWRMACAWTGATGFLCQDFAYHGITEAIDAVSPSASKTGVLPPHVRTLMAPDTYNNPGLAAEDFAADTDRAIASLAEAGVKPAAVIIDSAFMTNGVLEPLPGYVAGVFERVRAAGGLCIADEVQSGFGRMGGHFWGYQHHGVTPDFVTIGKPAGNGHPIGVVLTRPEILDHFETTTAFFSTFGGNNVSAAAGLAVLDAIDRQDLTDHAARMGARFAEGLRKLQARHPIIGCVRATGLAVGLELVADRATRAPAAAQTGRLIDLLKDEGVLVGSEGIRGNIVKMRPPLVVSAADIDFALAALDRALSRLEP
ncbi:aminotransferase class III-fold pyridoxal phosphate-dependent enzyme [Palleronia sp. KMU-117]|uniref:aminotransferase class III-fold pyridoxal phosphate-dependent enzyme n=1 Tax=Palleronia sp. KMU-117 TaxID=3434108 RepID=UPI003D736A26